MGMFILENILNYIKNYQFINAKHLDNNNIRIEVKEYRPQAKETTEFFHLLDLLTENGKQKKYFNYEEKLIGQFQFENDIFVTIYYV